MTTTKKKPKANEPAPPSYLAVLPFMHRPYFDACMATSKINVRPVDNTVTNAGCTVAWNMGLKWAMDEGIDWCIWMSAAVRFGERGGLDFIEALAANPHAHVVESQARGHFLAVHRRVTERIGYCDENFWPSYYQDTDWARRVWLAFPDEIVWKRVEIGIRSESLAHGIQIAGLRPDLVSMEAYYRAKWGTCPGGMWAHPFNDPSLPLSWWAPPGHHLALPRPRAGQFIAVEGA